ncbi:hypothetical protein BDV18DRAFT_57906 [Aspergillus unguis]
MLTEPGTSSSNGDTPKLRTACENCRQSKVKCNQSGKDTCIRCLHHGLPCRYRVANRSGKPKGSKNRSTLRKLGQLQENKSFTTRECITPDNRLAKRSIEAIPSPGFTRSDTEASVPTDHLESPIPDIPDASLFLADCTDYPSLYDESMSMSMSMSASGSPCAASSMSPTFLQKEFITKGLTSFPLAVHVPVTVPVPSALRPACDCAETLVFYHDHLRQIVTNPAQVRFDQMLQGVQAALSVCRGFLQCPSGHGVYTYPYSTHKETNPNDTNLLLCMSTLELAIQALDYWTSFELLPQSHSRDHDNLNPSLSNYGEYETTPDEARRIRRFLLRGRLVLCKETLRLFKGVAGSGLGLGIDLDTDGNGWLQQIIAGSEAMTETFLHALAEADCICSSHSGSNSGSGY